jgi:hypothetical protein
MSSHITKRQIDGWIVVLQTWASLGAELTTTRLRDVPSWDPMHRLIDVAREKLAGDRDRLRNLLSESRQRMAPLEDPFDIDLGLHRWLEAQREEAYSDWLEWTIRQMPGSKQVFELFDLEQPDAVLECNEWDVLREFCVPHGHPDQEGRLDLVIRFADVAIIVVEVKKGDADGADTAKHCGYNDWLEEQDYTHKYPVLLAASAEDTAYESFSFCSWATACIQMRRQAIHICREGQKKGQLMTAAMILAFVAAVEQNLLGFSFGVVRDICNGRDILFNVEVVDYLERFINKLEK